MFRLKENEVYYFKYDNNTENIIDRKIVSKPADWIRFNKESGWVTNRFHNYIECWYLNFVENKNDEYKNKINNLIKHNINYLKKVRIDKIKRIL
jgi:hypothetical protein